MDFLLVLAQDAPKTGPRISLAERLFERYPAVVAVPLFVVALVVGALVLERALAYLARRISARTQTKVDDAFAAGLPSVLRPLFALGGLHVVANLLLRYENDKGGNDLSETGAWVTTALSVLSVFVLGFCVTRLALRMVDAWLLGQPDRAPIGPPIKFGIKVAMVPLTILVAAEIGGAQITSLLAAASVPALAVGLALQDTLKNMFAGMQIILDQPIRVGDFVEVDKNARGTVLEIGLRSTKLRSADNNTIILPNSTIANAIVTNLDYADRSFIQTFEVSVAYGSDTRRVQQLLEEVVTTAATELEGVVADPHPAALRRLGESSIDFAVNVRFRQWAGRLPLVSELYHRFYARLTAEGVDIPFPTRTIHLAGGSGPLSAAPGPSP